MPEIASFYGIVIKLLETICHRIIMRYTVS